MQALEDAGELWSVLHVEPDTMVVHEDLDFLAIGRTDDRAVKQFGGHSSLRDTQSNISRIVLDQEALIDSAL